MVNILDVYLKNERLGTLVAMNDLVIEMGTPSNSRGKNKRNMGKRGAV